MHYTIGSSEHDAQVSILLNGQFTFADHPHFKELIELTNRPEIEELRLDFAQLEFIDSAGLGMLLLLRDECEKKRIRTSLRGMQGQVAKIFNLSKFEQLFFIAS